MIYRSWEPVQDRSQYWTDQYECRDRPRVRDTVILHCLSHCQGKTHYYYYYMYFLNVIYLFNVIYLRNVI